jgi:hypothetical protein
MPVCRAPSYSAVTPATQHLSRYNGHGQHHNRSRRVVSSTETGQYRYNSPDSATATLSDEELWEALEFPRWLDIGGRWLAAGSALALSGAIAGNLCARALGALLT